MTTALAPPGTDDAPEGIFGLGQLDRIPQLARLPADYLFELRVVAAVLPFRVNSHTISLIDWDRAPDDPLFRIVFPHRGMLDPASYEAVAAALRAGASPAAVRALAAGLRRQLNPHPGGQQDLNAPSFEGATVEGVQHKYRQTVLFFPSEGQTCHAFCTFCFRWAQFVQEPELRMATQGSARLAAYLRAHHEVTDVLFTGGDPFVMKTRRLRALLEPLRSEALSHLRTIRFGTKALAFQPERFLSDADADDLLNLLQELVQEGRHVAVMAHFNHWRELSPAVTRRAIARIRATGAVIRSQSPILRGINDDPEVWARMWRDQVNVGVEPYYMFVARDTGAHSGFDMPLAEIGQIYREASRRVSGLAKTARGPVMSTAPGKIEFVGPAEVHGERVYVLRFLQARDEAWCGHPFFAAADDQASWFGDLRPAFGEARFFFEAPQDDCAPPLPRAP